MQEEAKTIVDGVAVSGGIATLAGWLPDLTALLTIVWLSLRIWESDTVQGWTRKDGSD
jgi:hypothetical protein